MQLITLDSPEEFAVPRRVSGRALVPGAPNILLTETSKMPGASWSIPAVQSCPFAKFGAGTICGACYARGSREEGRPTRYGCSNVQNAQSARWEWAKTCMRSEAGRDHFVAIMTDAIRRKRKSDTMGGALRRRGENYFRIHDSGDFFSEAYTRCWIRIAEALPHIQFWGPTRSHRAPWVQALIDLNALPNVTIRPSADRFNEPAPVVEGLAAGSTAVSDPSVDLPGTAICPAYLQGGECGECRTCWSNPSTPVAYKQH